VKIEWSPAARVSAHRYISDQDGMQAIGVAVSALAADPNPSAAFVRGDYRRLKVGSYRIMYVVEVDVITIERVDRVI
jgi:mRNA-degrading endonuclease RelE of RelBE toxin-antitoxin system